MTYEDLKGKKVLVTGSSSGIGRATAILFARQGCFVGVHYFKTKTGGEKTLKEVRKYGDGVCWEHLRLNSVTSGAEELTDSSISGGRSG
jgi:NAD(P)-dependent dehydrogenase (short-subunit alcohol dehydrogenase family)